MTTNAEPSFADLLDLDDKPTGGIRAHAEPVLAPEPEAPRFRLCQCPFASRPRKRHDGTCPTCSLPRVLPKSMEVQRSTEPQESASPAALAGVQMSATEAPSAPASTQESAPQATEQQRVLRGETVVAGLQLADMGELFSWDGLGDITNARMRKLGETNGIPKEWMLDPESAKLQASRAVKDVCKGKGVVISVVNKGEEIERTGDEKVSFISRWTVGRVDHSTANKKLGTKLVTVTLEESGELTIDGDTSLEARIREAYAKRTESEVHRSSDITR